MRRSLLNLCSKIDLDGKPSAYYPQFRPRRLVMPVDPDKVHSNKRARNPLMIKYKDQQRMRKIAERRGSIKLAAVPAERTVGDMFRYMLEVCDEHRLFDPRASFSGEPWRPLEGLVKQAHEAVEADRARAAAAAASGGQSASRTDLQGSGTSGSGSAELSLRAVDAMWGLLDRTPLNAPVHGALAQRGKAVVERAIAGAAYGAYPRLRSKHLQQLLHESCGLLPAGRVALRLGLAQHAGVEGEIGMWRELNVLNQRVRTARRLAAAHLERVDKGVAQQRRWYWRGVLKAAAGRIKMFPVEAADLQPRLEWVRSSIFAYVGFLEMAQRSGEAGVDPETFVMKMFCSQLGQFAYRRRLLQDAERLSGELLLAVGDGAEGEGDPPRIHLPAEKRQHLAEDIAAELRRLEARTPDEMEVLEARHHPLNDRADLRREQFESSGGLHGVQSLKDDLADDYRVGRHSRAAPPAVVHSIGAQNALKEAQLVLRYAPDVPAALRNAPIDVDQVVHKTVEVHETNNYASLHYDQQYRPVEYTVCRLYCGAHCVGEGKGETLMEAIQQAALHTATNYYLGRPRAPTTTAAATGDVTADSGCATDERTSATVGEVRMRGSRTEEELSF